MTGEINQTDLLDNRSEGEFQIPQDGTERVTGKDYTMISRRVKIDCILTRTICEIIEEYLNAPLDVRSFFSDEFAGLSQRLLHAGGEDIILVAEAIQRVGQSIEKDRARYFELIEKLEWEKCQNIRIKNLDEAIHQIESHREKGRDHE